MFVDQFWHHIKDDDDEEEVRWKSGSRFINIRCLRFLCIFALFFWAPCLWAQIYVLPVCGCCIFVVFCFVVKIAEFKQCVGIRSLPWCLQSLLVQCFILRSAVIVAWFLGLWYTGKMIELDCEWVVCEMVLCRCSRCRIRTFDWSCVWTTYCSLFSNTRH